MCSRSGPRRGAAGELRPGLGGVVELRRVWWEGAAGPGHELEDVGGVGVEGECVERGGVAVCVEGALEAGLEGFLEVSSAGVGVLPEDGVAVGEGDGGAFSVGSCPFVIFAGPG